MYVRSLVRPADSASSRSSWRTHRRARISAADIGVNCGRSRPACRRTTDDSFPTSAWSTRRRWPRPRSGLDAPRCGCPEAEGRRHSAGQWWRRRRRQQRRAERRRRRHLRRVRVHRKEQRKEPPSSRRQRRPPRQSSLSDRKGKATAKEQLMTHNSSDIAGLASSGRQVAVSDRPAVPVQPDLGESGVSCRNDSEL
jgi:hypothetical protein